MDAFLQAVNWGFVEGRLKASPKNKRVNPAPESWLGDEFEDDTELK